MPKLSVFLFKIFCVLCALNSGTTAFAKEQSLLAGQWLFTKGSITQPSELVTNHVDWQTISVPHTFNVADAADGGGYYRGAGWYQKEFIVEDLGKKQFFLEFGAAALKADVWVNNQLVGSHKGGYSRFRFNISQYLQPNTNVLHVRVDNSNAGDIAPLGGDFTVYGGLYKSVSLITTDEVHIDLLDYGSDGVYADITEVSASSATLTLRTKVRNDSSASQQVTVVHLVKNAEGKVVNRLQGEARVAPKQAQELPLTTKVVAPHLWQGVDNPYLYTVETQLEAAKHGDAAVVDKLVQEIGFRTIQIDADQGLLLNGKPYAVNGVNIHLTQRPEKGTAVNGEDIKTDFKILDELGVTGLRLAHYQHPQAIFEHANKQGYLLWAEVPTVSEVNGSETLLNNAKQQLIELIRQNYNHPSVFVWGIGNEIYKQDEASHHLLAELQLLAKQEDPSRYTVYANCCSPVNSGHAITGDINASNVYNGWYQGQDGEVGDWAAKAHLKIPNRPLAISEYGAGGSIYHQQSAPPRPDTAGSWHPEQYQTLVHENAWNSLKDKDYLWAKFVWVGFDFASDARAEGDRDGINDKGLVTFDRLTKKDAYFWYQANWSKKPMVHITSKRHVTRSEKNTDIKVYSNQAVVSLTINGTEQTAKKTQNKLAVWSDVELQVGQNTISVAVETPKGEKLIDSVIWQYQPKQ